MIAFADSPCAKAPGMADPSIPHETSTEWNGVMGIGSEYRFACSCGFRGSWLWSQDSQLNSRLESDKGYHLNRKAQWEKGMGYK